MTTYKTLSESEGFRSIVIVQGVSIEKDDNEMMMMMMLMMMVVVVVLLMRRRMVMTTMMMVVVLKSNSCENGELGHLNNF